MIAHAVKGVVKVFHEFDPALMALAQSVNILDGNQQIDLPAVRGTGRPAGA